MAALVHPQHFDRWQAWLTALRAHVRSVAGLELEDLERVVGPLPLSFGFESGDSPREFFAGAVEPLLVSEIR
jgi:hypothetical protein